jgi:hypothetical protein
MKHLKPLAAAIALTGSLMAAAPAVGQGICDSLWYERNEIYKRNGYCFKTARAIATFGNAGCAYDVEAAVPLSGWERRRIQELIRAERANGCRW